MKHWRLATLVALLVTSVIAPRPALAVNEGVVDDGDPPRFPNVGAYVVVSSHGVPIEPFALGSVSLIDERVVLTAGHLTALVEEVVASGFAELGDARVSFGTDPLDPATWLEIADVATHPDFRMTGLGTAIEHDLGAVVLAEAVEPVTLAPVGFLDALKASGALRERGAAMTVVGYGAMREFPPVRDVENHLRRFTDVVFGGLTQKWLTLLQNPVAHGGGANNGDSGGPAFWGDAATGGLVQVGVCSAGHDAAVNQYTRIDVADNRDFIDAVIADVEEADAR